MLTPYDSRLKQQVILRLSSEFFHGTTFRIPFQFPLYVKSDNKSAEWKEVNARDAEPIPIFMGGHPRDIDLAWTYIVTGEGDGDETWNTDTISRWVKTLRSYFYNRAGSAIRVEFQAYDVVGNPGDTWTFRAMSVGITHSDTIISDDNGVYPLRTDVTMKLRFFVDMGLSDLAQANAGDDVKLINVQGLKPFPVNSPEWF